MAGTPDPGIVMSVTFDSHQLEEAAEAAQGQGLRALGPGASQLSRIPVSRGAGKVQVLPQSRVGCVTPSEALWYRGAMGPSPQKGEKTWGVFSPFFPHLLSLLSPKHRLPWALSGASALRSPVWQAHQTRA